MSVPTTFMMLMEGVFLVIFHVELVREAELTNARVVTLKLIGNNVEICAYALQAFGRMSNQMLLIVSFVIPTVAHVLVQKTPNVRHVEKEE